MKEKVLMLLLVFSFGTSKMFCIEFPMVGYATVAGEGHDSTTGGAGGDTIHIYNYGELETWAISREKKTTPEIALIHGKITSESSVSLSVKHGENISILGAGDSAELQNVGLDIWDYKNVIVHNLKIHEILYPNDALTISECFHVWVDHCELHSKIGDGIGVDTYDGLLDIKKGSRYVTVSWCYIHHHMKTMLIGHTDNESQKPIDSLMRVTIHHNYFSNTDGRNPSLRFGAVHMFNNYLEDIADYGIAVRQGAHALLENNHYHSVKTPITTNKFDGPEGFVCESGTIYSGTCSAADNSITQTDCDFWSDLPYTYQLDATEDDKEMALKYTGVGKNDRPGGDFTGDTTSNEEPVKDIRQIDENLSLMFELYPNPMNQECNLIINAPKSGIVNISVLDIYGRIVKNTILKEIYEGENSLVFQKDILSSGIYYVALKFKGQIVVKKLIIK